jgi:hypothetical protein
VRTCVRVCARVRVRACVCVCGVHTRRACSASSLPFLSLGLSPSVRQVRRIDKRLEHMGVEVRRRFDEEYSVIPMGGPLPVLGQPTVATPTSRHVAVTHCHVSLLCLFVHEVKCFQLGKALPPAI